MRLTSSLLPFRYGNSSNREKNCDVQLKQCDQRIKNVHTDNEIIKKPHLFSSIFVAAQPVKPSSSSSFKCDNENHSTHLEPISSSSCLIASTARSYNMTHLLTHDQLKSVVSRSSLKTPSSIPIDNYDNNKTLSSSAQRSSSMHPCYNKGHLLKQRYKTPNEPTTTETLEKPIDLSSKASKTISQHNLISYNNTTTSSNILSKNIPFFSHHNNKSILNIEYNNVLIPKKLLEISKKEESPIKHETIPTTRNNTLLNHNLITTTDNPINMLSKLSPKTYRSSNNNNNNNDCNINTPGHHTHANTLLQPLASQHLNQNSTIYPLKDSNILNPFPRSTISSYPIHRKYETPLIRQKTSSNIIHHQLNDQIAPVQTFTKYTSSSPYKKIHLIRTTSLLSDTTSKPNVSLKENTLQISSSNKRNEDDDVLHYRIPTSPCSSSTSSLCIDRHSKNVSKNIQHTSTPINNNISVNTMNANNNNKKNINISNGNNKNVFVVDESIQSPNIMINRDSKYNNTISLHNDNDTTTTTLKNPSLIIPSSLPRPSCIISPSDDTLKNQCNNNTFQKKDKNDELVEHISSLDPDLLEALHGVLVEQKMNNEMKQHQSSSPLQKNIHCSIIKDNMNVLKEKIPLSSSCKETKNCFYEKKQCQNIKHMTSCFNPKIRSKRNTLTLLPEGNIIKPSSMSSSSSSAFFYSLNYLNKRHKLNTTTTSTPTNTSNKLSLNNNEINGKNDMILHKTKEEQEKNKKLKDHHSHLNNKLLQQQQHEKLFIGNMPSSKCLVSKENYYNKDYTFSLSTPSLKTIPFKSNQHYKQQQQQPYLTKCLIHQDNELIETPISIKQISQNLINNNDSLLNNKQWHQPNSLLTYHKKNHLSSTLYQKTGCLSKVFTPPPCTTTTSIIGSSPIPESYQSSPRQPKKSKLFDSIKKPWASAEELKLRTPSSIITNNKKNGSFDIDDHEQLLINKKTNHFKLTLPTTTLHHQIITKRQQSRKREFPPYKHNFNRLVSLYSSSSLQKHHHKDHVVVSLNNSGTTSIPSSLISKSYYKNHNLEEGSYLSGSMINNKNPTMNNTTSLNKYSTKEIPLIKSCTSPQTNISSSSSSFQEQSTHNFLTKNKTLSKLKNLLLQQPETFNNDQSKIIIHENNNTPPNKITLSIQDDREWSSLKTKEPCYFNNSNLIQKGSSLLKEEEDITTQLSFLPYENNDIIKDNNNPYSSLEKELSLETHTTNNNKSTTTLPLICSDIEEEEQQNFINFPITISTPILHSIDTYNDEHNTSATTMETLQLLLDHHPEDKEEEEEHNTNRIEHITNNTIQLSEQTSLSKTIAVQQQQKNITTTIHDITKPLFFSSLCKSNSSEKTLLDDMSLNSAWYVDSSISKLNPESTLASLQQQQSQHEFSYSRNTNDSQSKFGKNSINGQPLKPLCHPILFTCDIMSTSSPIIQRKNKLHLPSSLSLDTQKHEVNKNVDTPKKMSYEEKIKLLSKDKNDKKHEPLSINLIQTTIPPSPRRFFKKEQPVTGRLTFDNNMLLSSTETSPTSIMVTNTNNLPCKSYDNFCSLKKPVFRRLTQPAYGISNSLGIAVNATTRNTTNQMVSTSQLLKCDILECSKNEADKLSSTKKWEQPCILACNENNYEEIFCMGSRIDDNTTTMVIDNPQTLLCLNVNKEELRTPSSQQQQQQDHSSDITPSFISVFNTYAKDTTSEGITISTNDGILQIYFALPPMEIIRKSDLILINLISKGTFGTVYKGTLKGEEVAIKLLNSNSNNNNTISDAMRLEEVKNFQREVNAYRTLRDHPRIVKYIGVCMEITFLAIVTEYLPQGNVFDLFFDNKILISAVVRHRMATQLLEAICFLHNRKIIHRDLKTSNLVIDNNFNIKLCDFGKTTMMTGTHIILSDNGGSPRYMAPECYHIGAHINEKSDIWSLGCCLIELFGGPIPYEELLDNASVLEKILREHVVPSVPSWFCPNLRFILQQCFSWNPEERPNIEELLSEMKSTSVETMKHYGMDHRH